MSAFVAQETTTNPQPLDLADQLSSLESSTLFFSARIISFLAATSVLLAGSVNGAALIATDPGKLFSTRTPRATILTHVAFAASLCLWSPKQQRPQRWIQLQVLCWSF